MREGGEAGRGVREGGGWVRERGERGRGSEGGRRGVSEDRGRERE